MKQQRRFLENITTNHQTGQVGKTLTKTLKRLVYYLRKRGLVQKLIIIIQ